MTARDGMRLSARIYRGKVIRLETDVASRRGMYNEWHSRSGPQRVGTKTEV